MKEEESISCMEVELRLRQGEVWTRKEWLEHPLLVGKNPRILVLREHSASVREPDKTVDHFKQVWEGGPGEPALNMIYYRPSDEDWNARDWIKVENK